MVSIKKIIKNNIAVVKLFFIKRQVEKHSNWNDNARIKVLIYTNKYFTEDNWNVIINSYNIDESCFEIVFCSSKKRFYKYFKSADYCFLFNYNPNLENVPHKKKYLYIPMVGLDFLKKDKVSEDLILIEPPNFAGTSISEYCYSMYLVMKRGFHYAMFQQTSKLWDQSKILLNTFNKNATIGILGFGRIGSEIAKVFNSQGYDVIGYDISPIKSSYLINSYGVDDLKKFLIDIDVLIISIPLSEKTKHMISTKELLYLGKDSILINVSRGKVIDESALYTVLANNQIKGAILDVFSEEPLRAKSKLYKLDNVIITPHIAGNFNLFRKEIQADFLSLLMKGENYDC